MTIVDRFDAVYNQAPEEPVSRCWRESPICYDTEFYSDWFFDTDTMESNLGLINRMDKIQRPMKSKPRIHVHHTIEVGDWGVLGGMCTKIHLLPWNMTVFLARGDYLLFSYHHPLLYSSTADKLIDNDRNISVYKGDERQSNLGERIRSICVEYIITREDSKKFFELSQLMDI